jgi:hypothetical protein
MNKSNERRSECVREQEVRCKRGCTAITEEDLGISVRLMRAKGKTGITCIIRVHDGSLISTCIDVANNGLPGVARGERLSER